MGNTRFNPDFFIENDWYWYLYAHCKRVEILEQMTYTNTWEPRMGTYIEVEMWIGKCMRQTYYTYDNPEVKKKEIGIALENIAKQVYYYQCEYYEKQKEREEEWINSAAKYANLALQPSRQRRI